MKKNKKSQKSQKSKRTVAVNTSGDSAMKSRAGKAVGEAINAASPEITGAACTLPDSTASFSRAEQQVSAPTQTNGRIYGYARVSTREQNEARQIDALMENGVELDHIILDKQSGKDFDRPGYNALLEKLMPGDTLFIKSIDRLGRNYDEIIEQWRIITREKRVSVVVIDMPLLDTRRDRDLTGTLIADLVLQLLSYVAETERNFIKQRQAEGIAAAKARGTKFGRRAILRPDSWREMYLRWKRKEISARQAAKTLVTHHSTFLRWARRYEGENGVAPLDEKPVQAIKEALGKRSNCEKEDGQKQTAHKPVAYVDKTSGQNSRPSYTTGKSRTRAIAAMKGQPLISGKDQHIRLN